jgi:hypothetical protein
VRAAGAGADVQLHGIFIRMQKNAMPLDFQRLKNVLASLRFIR